MIQSALPFEIKNTVALLKQQRVNHCRILVKTDFLPPVPALDPYERNPLDVGPV